MIVLSQKAANVAVGAITDFLTEAGLPTDACAVAAVRWIVANEKCGFDRTDPVGRQFIELCSRRGVNPITDDVTAYKSGGALTFIVGVQTLLDRAHATGLLTSVETDVVLRASADGRQARIARAIVRRWVTPTDTLQAEHARRVADVAKLLEATERTGLVEASLLPVVEREFRAEANVDEWAAGQTSTFWKGKPEHQAQLVALRRALRNSGLVADPDEDVASWAQDGSDAAPAPSAPQERPAPAPTGSPSVDRARAALAVVGPTTTASTTAPVTADAPAPAEAPHFTDSAADFRAQVAAAAKPHGLTPADVEAFCQAWKGKAMATLDDADRVTLVSKVLAGPKIATADERTAVEALRTKLGAAFDAAYTAAGGTLPYAAARVMSAVAQKLTVAAPATTAYVPPEQRARLSAAQREDIEDIATGFINAKLGHLWTELATRHAGGVAGIAFLSPEKAQALLTEAHSVWERASAEQAKTAAAGGWA